MLRNEIAAAEEILGRCLAIRQDDPKTLLLRGEIALRSGRREEAKDCARWALFLNAKDTAALSLFTRSETRTFRLGGRFILPAIALILILPIADSVLHVGADTVRVACWVVSGGITIFVVSSSIYLRRCVRREMRDVSLRRDF